MNKYSEQKLNKRNKNTAKQTNRISATFDINHHHHHHHHHHLFAFIHI